MASPHRLSPPKKGASFGGLVFEEVIGEVKHSKGNVKLWRLRCTCGAYKMFIELSALPLSAPLYDLVLMPKRSQTEDWVEAIRVSIRILLEIRTGSLKTCF